MKRPPIGINPAIPLPVQRELRKVAAFAFDAQDNANRALAALPNKVGFNNEDLTKVSAFTNGALSAGGSSPLNLTGLPGSPAFPLNKQGPGPGTYTVGAKLTPTGNNGEITIDSTGRITHIQQAT